MTDDSVKLREEQLKNMAQYEKKRRRIRKIISVLATWLLALVVLAAVLVIIVAVLRAVGAKNLKKGATSVRPVFEEENTEASGDTAQTDATEEEDEVIWEEGWVRHNGKIYEYNENILTFLVLGIDKNEEVSESKDEVSGGQSDGLFLVVANPDEKDIKIIAINRDTMTDVVMYGYGDDPIPKTILAQITVQHGFGDGKEKSCELTVDAVSKLFYSLPIHGYMSINMAGIPILNDAVGGVDVTILEDLPKVHKEWIKGTEVHLQGMDSYWYTKYRDHTVFDTARGRLARQKQYLTAFIQKAVAETKKDITFPIGLYKKLSKYMVTDITTDEVTYLVGELLDYHFDGDAIYTMEGETRMGEKHEEFYPDKEALKNLIIEIFYREVNINGK